MNRSDNLQIRTTIIGLVLALMSAVAIYAIYGGHLFHVWPWLRFSLVMSVLTCLWAYTFGFGLLNGGSENTLNPFTFLAIIPFDFILVYPGTEPLKLHSDQNVFVLLFTLVVIHGVGFYLLQKEIQSYSETS